LRVLRLVWHPARFLERLIRLRRLLYGSARSLVRRARRLLHLRLRRAARWLTDLRGAARWLTDLRRAARWLTDLRLRRAASGLTDLRLRGAASWLRNLRLRGAASWLRNLRLRGAASGLPDLRCRTRRRRHSRLRRRARRRRELRARTLLLCREPRAEPRIGLIIEHELLRATRERRLRRRRRRRQHRRRRTRRQPAKIFRPSCTLGQEPQTLLSPNMIRLEIKRPPPPSLSGREIIATKPIHARANTLIRRELRRPAALGSLIRPHRSGTQPIFCATPRSIRSVRSSGSFDCASSSSDRALIASFVRCNA
jgi:hypothetical protein